MLGTGGHGNTGHVLRIVTVSATGNDEADGSGDPGDSITKGENVARQRMIECAIWRDENFGTLSFFGQALWIGLFTTCTDDQGRLLDNPFLIKATLWPYRNIAIEDVEKELETFEQFGWIQRYEADGKKLVQVLGWWEHQSLQWAAASKWAAPSEWQDRIRTKIGELYVKRNWGDEKREGGDEQAEKVRKPRAARGVSYKPAVRAYYEAMKVRPNKVQIEAIEKAVADDAGGLRKWGAVLEAWRLAGYSPANVGGMLEWYRSGIPQGGKQRNNRPVVIRHDTDVETVIKLNERE